VTAPSDSESHNATTLAAYEARAEVYRAQTAHGPRTPDPLVERLAALAPPGVVLEIGSAYGGDADSLESLGRRVRRTDATTAFVQMQRAAGHDADVLDVLRDPLVDEQHGPYAAVLANAVFLHFSPDQLHRVLTAVRGALVPGGILGFTVKVGDGAGWSDHKLGVPRWFQYWRAEPLRDAIETAGLEVVDLSTRSGATWDWLVVLATPCVP
jgi:predicted TPR repeat methyltransferase